MAIYDSLKLTKMTAKATAYTRGYSCFKFAGLARSPFVLTEHMTSWRASETLSGLNNGNWRYVFSIVRKWHGQHNMGRVKCQPFSNHWKRALK